MFTTATLGVWILNESMRNCNLEISLSKNALRRRMLLPAFFCDNNVTWPMKLPRRKETEREMHFTVEVSFHWQSQGSDCLKIIYSGNIYTQ